MHPGGRIPTVLMQPPPSFLSKLGEGGSAGGVWGRVSAAGVGGVPRWGGLRTTHYDHMQLRGGCMSGGLGVHRYVSDNIALSSLPRRKS